LTEQSSYSDQAYKDDKMDNQVFLPFTFAEIYNNTPQYMRGMNLIAYNSLYIATIQYAGKDADICVVYDYDTDKHAIVLADNNGKIL